jgi:hypothetical protein
LFPAPGTSQPELLPAFATAVLAPALVAGLFWAGASGERFEMDRLRREVTTIEE